MAVGWLSKTLPIQVVPEREGPKRKVRFLPLFIIVCSLCRRRLLPTVAIVASIFPPTLQIGMVSFQHSSLGATVNECALSFNASPLTHHSGPRSASMDTLHEKAVIRSPDVDHPDTHCVGVRCAVLSAMVRPAENERVFRQYATAGSHCQLSGSPGGRMGTDHPRGGKPRRC